MSIKQTICRKWLQRQKAVGLRGRAAEQDAVVFFAGAATALETLDSPEARDITVFVALCLACHPFPLAEIARCAASEVP